MACRPGRGIARDVMRPERIPAASQTGYCRVPSFVWPPLAAPPVDCPVLPPRDAPDTSRDRIPPDCAALLPERLEPFALVLPEVRSCVADDRVVAEPRTFTLVRAPSCT